MNSIFNRGFGYARKRVVNVMNMKNRKFSAANNRMEPEVPIYHDRAGQFLLIFTYLWIFFKARENKGQLLGLYSPWLHPHEHEEHEHFEHAGDHGDNMPTLGEEGEEHEHDDHEEEEEE